MENYWSYSLTVFMAFFAIMNPIVNIPIFVKLTEGVDEIKKKEISKTATLVAFIIVLAFILVGKYIFEIFGLTIPAFKVFGGILIFFIGFESFNPKNQAYIRMKKRHLTMQLPFHPWQFQYWPAREPLLPL